MKSYVSGLDVSSICVSMSIACSFRTGTICLRVFHCVRGCKCLRSVQSCSGGWQDVHATAVCVCVCGGGGGGGCYSVLCGLWVWAVIIVFLCQELTALQSDKTITNRHAADAGRLIETYLTLLNFIASFMIVHMLISGNSNIRHV